MRGGPPGFVGVGQNHNSGVAIRFQEQGLILTVHVADGGDSKKCMYELPVSRLTNELLLIFVLFPGIASLL